MPLPTINVRVISIIIIIILINKFKLESNKLSTELISQSELLESTTFIKPNTHSNSVKFIEPIKVNKPTELINPNKSIEPTVLALSNKLNRLIELISKSGLIETTDLISSSELIEPIEFIQPSKIEQTELSSANKSIEQTDFTLLTKFNRLIELISQSGLVGPTVLVSLTKLISESGLFGPIEPTRSIELIRPTGSTKLTRPTCPTELIRPTGSTGPIEIIGPTGPTGPTGLTGKTGPTGPIGKKGSDTLSNVGFIAVFGGDLQLTSQYLSYNGKYDTKISDNSGFNIPVSCILKGYSYAIEKISSGQLQINKNGTNLYNINTNIITNLGGYIDIDTQDEPSGYKTFKKGDCCKVLTNLVEFGKCTITLYFTSQSVTSMVSGHVFPMYSQFTQDVAGGEKQMLGVMKYLRISKLFASISSKDHYSMSGQCIQGRDGLSVEGKSYPWGSIEGGLFISEKLGGLRYHIAASSHRYNNRSDTLGGFGFYEMGLPFRYWSRVIMSDRLLLPFYGVCFPTADDGKLFGAGWIGMPFFDFSSSGIAKDPISWTFFADAENFSGPVCCYPPQFFARRIDSWGNQMLSEDPSLPTEYAITDISTGLAFTGPSGNVNLSVGGEIPNINCAFTSEEDDGSMVWKVPEIQIPSAGNVWSADTSFFSEKNFANVKAQLIEKSPQNKVTLLPKRSSVSGTVPIEIGVKQVVEVGVTEIDNVLKIDASIVPSADGNAYIIAGTDTGKPLSRYYVQTDEIKDQITNDTGKTVNRHWCVPTDPPNTLKNIEYSTGSKVVTFKNDILETYVRYNSLDGIHIVTLEDGTTLGYGLVKFNEQPAITSLADDFPDDFTQEKLDELQARFEFLMTSNFTNQTRRSSWTQTPGKLTRVDPAMLITPVLGYVPIVIGSYPASGPDHKAGKMYTKTW